jgi:hypothetical protein
MNNRRRRDHRRGYGARSGPWDGSGIGEEHQADQQYGKYDSKASNDKRVREKGPEPFDDWSLFEDASALHAEFRSRSGDGRTALGTRSAIDRHGNRRGSG